MVQYYNIRPTRMHLKFWLDDGNMDIMFSGLFIDTEILSNSRIIKLSVRFSKLFCVSKATTKLKLSENKNFC
jgi:hypothetical protein